MEVKFSETGLEFLDEFEEDDVFILEDFESESFHKLHRAGARIVGPPVIIRCVQTGEVSCSSIQNSTLRCIVAQFSLYLRY